MEWAYLIDRESCKRACDAITMLTLFIRDSAASKIKRRLNSVPLVS
jgi:hypothetical protein